MLDQQKHTGGTEGEIYLPGERLSQKQSTKVFPETWNEAGVFLRHSVSSALF